MAQHVDQEMSGALRQPRDAEATNGIQKGHSLLTTFRTA